ncbi:hypothetical protein Esi_0158_0032 [Ectocarpus siliculosus]|uniref:Uncharacterized protein n=1 Tax=Ectocarpus siliculosus TaxID=2880 RepID=D8LG83_ECTSI|nr:hypothetical protein Esi_0158_0032 [Ectocarpus siliculosus]|eukprot:CBN78982.1 hypothetical protein Esi_0158_0032 [Ectocarpus siliculosus]
MHDGGDRLAPRWVVLLDTDEFLWAREAGEIGLPEALESRSTTCCLQVSTVQHGTSGFPKSPRGLLLENFLTHADPTSPELNGPPKVILRFRDDASGTASESSGEDVNPPVSVSSFLGDGDGGGVTEMREGCRCEEAGVGDFAVRRYPMTREDVAARGRRYSTVLQWQQQQQRRAMTREAVEFDESLETAALNDHKSDAMVEWSCVVRRLLDRAANGKHLVTGRPQASLSPHHPISHGARAMDPYGEEELRRTEACMSAVRASPAAADTAWGSPDSSPEWLQHLCFTRYVFVHSFEDAGEAAVMRSLASHPWVRVHGGQGAVGGEGSSLTTVFSSPREREGMAETVLSELCGCSKEGSSAAGCWRYCPDLQQRLLAPEEINGARRQLVQDWLLRVNLKPKKPAVVLVERDTDMLVASKQGLFPFVSTSLLTVRHPICTTALETGDADGKCGTAAGLREWREVWRQVLIEQVPRTVNGTIWVVRFEDLLSQEENAASALWAAVGLPPISPYLPPATTKPAVIPISKKRRDQQHLRRRRLQHQTLPQQEQQQRPLGSGRRRRLIMGDATSRASSTVRNTAIPTTCRLRIGACEKDPACKLELLRSASLLDFFGYGGVGELLNSQRFLWGKEELEWLGKRLAAEPSELLDVLNGRERGGRLDFDSDDEPSVILLQPPQA